VTWSPIPSVKNRNQSVIDIAGRTFDVCVIGGGATGAGCALDAQLRGMKTVLLDAGDFAGATSSTSTKIVHGGVRYLEAAVKGFDPAQYRVVKRALQERIRMLKNAPHLAHTMEFLLPCFAWMDAAYYDAGLKLYDWISGSARLFPSRFVSREETLRRMPALKREKLIGSIVYADGQFDDARYNVALVDTFADAGGEALNYARVSGFAKDSSGRLTAAEVEDKLTGTKFSVPAGAFVNATGPFSDTVRTLATANVAPRMRLSKGIHVLLPLEVMPGDDALLIPKTEDGRVLFAVPWMGRLLVGTTEQEIGVHDELYVTKDEVEYLLHHLNQYLERPVKADCVVSGIAGARPLVSSGDSRDTKKLARDDVLEIDAANGLISIMGGKWTTYRAMAEDTIDAAQEQLKIPKTESSTKHHLLSGAEGFTAEYWETLVDEYRIPEEPARHLAEKFGARAPRVLDLAREAPALAEPLLEGSPVLRAEVVYCARNEMAVTIEDVLFRRLGVQLYSWRDAMRAAPIVASILGAELGWPAGAEHDAIESYVKKISRYVELAGLAAETGANGAAAQSASEA